MPDDQLPPQEDNPNPTDSGLTADEIKEFRALAAERKTKTPTTPPAAPPVTSPTTPPQQPSFDFQRAITQALDERDSKAKTEERLRTLESGGKKKRRWWEPYGILGN